MKNKQFLWFFLIALALVIGACTPQASTPASQAQGKNNAGDPQVTFTLQTDIVDGKMVYVGAGGTIDGKINPDLEVYAGQSFQVVLTNGDGMPHDLAAPDIGFQTAMVMSKGQSVSMTGSTTDSGEYVYFCTVSGHRQAGMQGWLIVSKP